MKDFDDALKFRKRDAVKDTFLIESPSKNDGMEVWVPSQELLKKFSVKFLIRTAKTMSYSIFKSATIHS